MNTTFSIKPVEKNEIITRCIIGISGITFQCLYKVTEALSTASNLSVIVLLTEYNFVAQKACITVSCPAVLYTDELKYNAEKRKILSTIQLICRDDYEL